MKANVCRNFTFQVNRTKNATKKDASPLATELPCQHFIARTTQQTFFGYKLGELTENNKAPLFSSGKKTIQTFNGPI